MNVVFRIRELSEELIYLFRKDIISHSFNQNDDVSHVVFNLVYDLMCFGRFLTANPFYIELYVFLAYL